MKNSKLILASSSPRRATLLTTLGVEFTVLPANIDESVLANESCEQYALRVAKDKTLAIASTITNANQDLLILASDTCVVLDKTILGKPVDKTQAKAMLSSLAGRTHRVMTSVALGINKNTLSGDIRLIAYLSDHDKKMPNEKLLDTKLVDAKAVDSDFAKSVNVNVNVNSVDDYLILSCLQVSDVSFKTLSSDEIQAYCETPEPYDKAGGYGIQGYAGVFVKKLKGSYSGVMGLPLFETNELIKLSQLLVDNE